MSIEDPRLSSIDNTSAANDFDSAVEQHLGFASETVEGIEVAQAETPDAGRTDRLPAQPPVQTAAATIPTEVTPDANNVVTLPAGIELDNLEFQVDGANLVLVLADGTEIVVVGGAANIPTFVIGEVELPQVALFAALEGSNINVAAGPDGSFSAQSTPESSRDFEDNQIGDGFEEFALASLLNGTDFGDDITFDDDGINDGVPIAGDLAPLGFDEAALVTLSETDNVITGTLPFQDGGDFATITAINLAGFGGAGFAGNVAEPGTTASAFPLTSDGLPLTIVTNTVDSRDPVRGFVALEAFKTVQVGETTQTVLVFRVTVTDRVTGAFSFELFESLDHPDLNEADAADLLRLAFTFTVTDLDGDSDEGTFSVDVADDAATISLPVTVVDGVPQPTVGVVEEEELDGGNEDVGNPDLDGGLDADFILKGEGSSELKVTNGFQNKTTNFVQGGLGISWGADDADLSDVADFGTSASVGNRSVSFVVPQPGGSEGEGSELEIAAKSTGTGLTSNGYAVVYEYSADGKTLTAYRFDGKSYYNDAGEVVPSDENGEAVVFRVVLSDNGSGSYTFTLSGTLDHNGEGEDALQLDFQFTATDSDGDTTAPATFTVKVIDDVPVRGEEVRGTAEDESVNNGNNESADGLSAVARGDLNLKWGADDADTLADLGGTGDRSIAFTNATVAVANAYNGTSLTSLGLAVSTTVLANGTLVGYTGPTAPTSISGANVVFHATLSDNGTGSYTVTLVQPLDHAPGNGSNGENSLSLTFGYTATDSDGDTVTGSFVVDIVDDVAKIGTPFAGGVVEEEQYQVAGDGNEDTSGTGDSDGFFNTDRTTHETGGTLAITWGSDDKNDGDDQPGDRSVQFGPDAVANLTALSLTSDGDTLKYTTITTASGQQILLAYTGSTVPTVLPSSAPDAIAANVVFSVALSDDGAGSYAFKLYDTLDHKGSVQGEDSQVLTFQFTATDSDGDVTAPSTFSVSVIDDKPFAIGTILDRYVEEEELSGGNEDDAPGDIAPDADGNYPFFGHQDLTTDKAGAPLNISWGGDDGNTRVNGGFTGTQVAGDRSVVFATGNGASEQTLTPAQVAQFLTVSGGAGAVAIGSLTSEGKPLVFTLSADGDVLTAHAGSGTGAVVFTVSLSDAGSGSYDFDLNGVLDHPVKASGASNEDVLSFTFTFTARDGDGDIATNNFTVKVIDDVPVRGEEVRGTAEDESVNNGNNESADGLSAVARGDLNLKWGADDADTLADLGGTGDRSIAFTNATVAVANAYNGTSLTSLGVPVSTTVLANGTLVGYTGPTAPTSISGANVVFHATLSDNGTGSYTVTLVQPLDHAPGNGSNGENSLSLTFGYTATDSDGDTVTGSFVVDIVDDVAKIGTPFAGGVVEEEQYQVAGDGNEDTSGTGDSDGFFNTDRTTHETGGTLAITWGSDDKNDGDDQPGDRSVQFGPDAVANLTALSLTSDGDTLKYTTITTASGQQILLAYTGSTVPTVLPSSAPDAIAANVVFSVALSDDGAGSYAFKLYDTLDHKGSVQGEDSQVLTFQFTATDSDGDVTAPSTFSVSVIDDKPFAIGTILDRYVEEEELSGGNEDTEPVGSELAGAIANGGPVTDKAGAPLNISWGGDDGNTRVNGGFTGTQVAGDRSVVFATGNGASEQTLTPAQVAQFLTVSGGAGAVAIGSLTSEGKPLVFTLSADGDVLTAHAGSGTGAVVFTVSLSDAGSGSYDFDLNGVLDHPVKASGASNEDVLSFTFTFTARDGDGDIATNNFTVKVIDDVPVRGEEVRGTAEDESVNNGNNESADGLSAVARGDLNLKWGADDADTLADLGGTGDRSIAFTNATVAVANAYNGTSLTSLGLAVSTTVLANGTLVGYTGPTAPTSISGANVVFHATLSDNGTGSYTVTLVQPLDHAPGNGSNGENSLSLTFGYTATDSDGDTVTGSFVVDIVDDVAKIGTPFAGGVVEEEQYQVAGDGNEDTSGTGDSDGFFNTDRTTHETGGTLAITWGSDDKNDGDDQPGDRSVQFGPDAVANLTALSLTSDGDTLKYTTITTASGQQILLAYTGSTVPTVLPSSAPDAIAANVVFSVALSDDGAGSYAFKLYDTLDHKGSVQGEDSQVLTFQFTATDSDGDVTAPSTFSVSVIDDKPFAIGTILDRYVRGRRTVWRQRRHGAGWF